MMYCEEIDSLFITRRIVSSRRTPSRPRLIRRRTAIRTAAETETERIPTTVATVTTAGPVTAAAATAVTIPALPVAPLTAEASRAEPNNRRLQADSAAIGGDHTKKNRKTKIKTQRVCDALTNEVRHRPLLL